MAIILKTDGTKDYIRGPKVLDGGQPEFVDRLREIVGGNVEYVDVLFEDKAIYMVINETGSLDELPMNVAASQIYFANTMKKMNISLSNAFRSLPYIYGDVVLLNDVELK